MMCTDKDGEKTDRGLLHSIKGKGKVVPALN
jgi:hypothetical protein